MCKAEERRVNPSEGLDLNKNDVWVSRIATCVVNQSYTFLLKENVGLMPSPQTGPPNITKMALTLHEICNHIESIRFIL